MSQQRRIVVQWRLTAASPGAAAAGMLYDRAA
jgi:hypothetical protein